MDEPTSDIDFETYVQNNPVIEKEKTPKPKKQEEVNVPKRKNRGNIIVPEKITIKESPVHNQGVFAIKDILEGEIVEKCPLLLFDWRAKYQSDPIMKQYMWTNISCKCKDCKMHSPMVYIPLGYGSLYNHSESPNVIVEIDWIEQTATFKTIKTVLIGEELFVNYKKIK